MESHRRRRHTLSKILALVGLATLLFAGCGDQPDDVGEDGPKPGLSNAQIVENPNNALSAIVEVKTEQPSSVELEVQRDGETVQKVGPTDQGADHELNVLGLHAETTYDFKLKASTGEDETESVTREFETGSLPDDFPPIKVQTAKPDEAADGIRLMSLYRWKLESEGSGYQTGWGMIVGVDESGEVVWYYEADHWTWNAKRLSNGNLAYIIADETIVEIDMMGNEVNRWEAESDLGRSPENDSYGIHHSILEKDDGNFLTLSTELREIEGFDSQGETSNVIGDVAVEFTRDGEVVDSSTMFDVLSDFHTRRRYGSGGPKWNDEYGTSTNDWSHANALAFGDDPGTLIASLRHQDWVVKWDRESSELLWRLGPEGDFEFPQGSDGEFNYHQHAPKFLENGNLMLYDNGNFRASVGQGEDFYTRAVEYELDASGVDIEAGEKGTVRQVWEYKNPPKYYAPHVGDADLLPNDTVMIADGGLLEDPSQCIEFTGNDGGYRDKYRNRTWQCIADPENLNWARLLEVTHDDAKEKVLEIWIKDQSDDKPRGYTMYRAEFLESLYPEGGASTDEE